MYHRVAWTELARSCYYPAVTKGEETRAAILDHAVALASRIGLGGLSIGDLARETGLSKSGLFAHFDSKLNLQLEVLRTSADRFVASVLAPALKKPRGVPRIRALFENWLSWSQHASLPGGCFFVAAANELDDQPGPLRDQLLAYQRDWISALTTAARIAVEERQFRKSLDLTQFAYDFYSILLAYHHFSRLMADQKAEARARRSLEKLIEDSRA
jgi:AcrR family transcriptional regulator